VAKSDRAQLDMKLKRTEQPVASTRRPHRVKLRRTQYEQMFSAQLELGHRLMLRRNPFRPFLADLIEARVRLGERRHIKVCEGSIASVAGVTMVDRALAQRWQWMGNYGSVSV